jgi:hypothetical protein
VLKIIEEMTTIELIEYLYQGNELTDKQLDTVFQLSQELGEMVHARLKMKMIE